MSAYIPALIWLLSAVFCIYIAKTRHVKTTLMRKLIVVLLGPFAIPLVFFAKPEKTINENQNSCIKHIKMYNVTRGLVNSTVMRILEGLYQGVRKIYSGNCLGIYGDSLLISLQIKWGPNKFPFSQNKLFQGHTMLEASDYPPKKHQPKHGKHIHSLVICAFGLVVQHLCYGRGNTCF